ncbi:helix-turn-helix transcriptional regulator [Methylorubrum sp. SL192]|uniref:helix-turn-helix transcriptional regulator n=1 Tax=Methylorubrum sp. SL192 TaxID=2995167 RepID=UPI002DD43F2A|nr:helix-turn-helix domain-containing protein [Methylorubrum sp. SL192]
MPIVRHASEKFTELAPRHFRAARALLDWTQEHLAQRAKVVRRTIVAVETGRGRSQPRKVQALLDAFRNAGVEFKFEPDGAISIVDASRKPEAHAPSEKRCRTPPDGVARARADNESRVVLNTRVSGRCRSSL